MNLLSVHVFVYEHLDTAFVHERLLDFFNFSSDGKPTFLRPSVLYCTQNDELSYKKGVGVDV